MGGMPADSEMVAYKDIQIIMTSSEMLHLPYEQIIKRVVRFLPSGHLLLTDVHVSDTPFRTIGSAFLSLVLLEKRFPINKGNHLFKNTVMERYVRGHRKMNERPSKDLHIRNRYMG